MDKPIRVYGHKRGVVEVKYPKMLFCTTKLKTLPTKIDLRAGMPDVYDQGELGSCTANAIAAALEYNIMKMKQKNTFIPSRLYIYYNERRKRGNVGIDSGAMISDGIESVRTLGLCPEVKGLSTVNSNACWPYDITKFTRQPPAPCYAFGKGNKAVTTRAVLRDINQLKLALQAGYPVTVGIVVYESFESENVTATGMVPMPSINESILGGHAVLICGYDDSISSFIVRNSWGDKWGDKGYCYIPYRYILNPNMSSEFYTITQVCLRY